VLTDSIGTAEDDCSATMEVCDFLSESDDGLEDCLHCEGGADTL